MSKESIYRAIEDNKKYLDEAMKRMKFPCSAQLVAEDSIIAQRVLREITVIIGEKAKAEGRERRRQEHIERIRYLVGAIFGDGFTAAEIMPMFEEAVKTPKIRTRKRSIEEPAQGLAQSSPQSDPA